jgi:cytoskeletal protein CcmA (bactofilin family)
MFNKDAIFGKREDTARREQRNVNVTPGLTTPSSARGQSEAAPSAEPQPEPGPPPAKVDVKADTEKGSKLIVGPDIKLKGVEITDCDTLVVEGRVEAAMDSRVIRIAEQGMFSGTVGIDVAEIHGRFEGELTARKQLVIHATGRVSGKIRYGTISVKEGGELSGDVATLSKSANGEKGARSSAASADIMTAYDPFARKNASAQTAKQS